jgi:hypothetical protein
MDAAQARTDGAEGRAQQAENRRADRSPEPGNGLSHSDAVLRPAVLHVPLRWMRPGGRRQGDEGGFSPAQSCEKLAFFQQQSALRRRRSARTGPLTLRAPPDQQGDEPDDQSGHEP